MQHLSSVLLNVFIGFLFVQIVSGKKSSHVHQLETLDAVTPTFHRDTSHTLKSSNKMHVNSEHSKLDDYPVEESGNEATTNINEAQYTLQIELSDPNKKCVEGKNVIYKRTASNIHNKHTNNAPNGNKKKRRHELSGKRKSNKAKLHLEQMYYDDYENQQEDSNEGNDGENIDLNDMENNETNDMENMLIHDEPVSHNYDTCKVKQGKKRHTKHNILKHEDQMQNDARSSNDRNNAIMFNNILNDNGRNENKVENKVSKNNFNHKQDEGIYFQSFENSSDIEKSRKIFHKTNKPLPCKKEDCVPTEGNWLFVQPDDSISHLNPYCKKNLKKHSPHTQRVCGSKCKKKQHLGGKCGKHVKTSGKLTLTDESKDLRLHDLNNAFDSHKQPSLTWPFENIDLNKNNTNLSPMDTPGRKKVADIEGNDISKTECRIYHQPQIPAISDLYTSTFQPSDDTTTFVFPTNFDDKAGTMILDDPEEDYDSDGNMDDYDVDYDDEREDNVAESDQNPTNLNTGLGYNIKVDNEIPNQMLLNNMVNLGTLYGSLDKAIGTYSEPKYIKLQNVANGDNTDVHNMNPLAIDQFKGPIHSIERTSDGNRDTRRNISDNSFEEGIGVKLNIEDMGGNFNQDENNNPQSINDVPLQHYTHKKCRRSKKASKNHKKRYSRNSNFPNQTWLENVENKEENGIMFTSSSVNPQENDILVDFDNNGEKMISVVDSKLSNKRSFDSSVSDGRWDTYEDQISPLNIRRLIENPKPSINEILGIEERFPNSYNALSGKRKIRDNLSSDSSTSNYRTKIKELFARKGKDIRNDDEYETESCVEYRGEPTTTESLPSSCSASTTQCATSKKNAKGNSVKGTSKLQKSKKFPNGSTPVPTKTNRTRITNASESFLSGKLVDDYVEEVLQRVSVSPKLSKELGFGNTTENSCDRCVDTSSKGITNLEDIRKTMKEYYSITSCSQDCPECYTVPCPLDDFLDLLIAAEKPERKASQFGHINDESSFMFKVDDSAVPLYHKSNSFISNEKENNERDEFDKEHVEKGYIRENIYDSQDSVLGLKSSPTTSNENIITSTQYYNSEDDTSTRKSAKIRHSKKSRIGTSVDKQENTDETPELENAAQYDSSEKSDDESDLPDGMDKDKRRGLHSANLRDLDYKSYEYDPKIEDPMNNHERLKYNVNNIPGRDGSKLNPVSKNYLRQMYEIEQPILSGKESLPRNHWVQEPNNRIMTANIPLDQYNFVPHDKHIPDNNDPPGDATFGKLRDTQWENNKNQRLTGHEPLRVDTNEILLKRPDRERNFVGPIDGEEITESALGVGTTRNFGEEPTFQRQSGRQDENFHRVYNQKPNALHSLKNRFHYNYYDDYTDYLYDDTADLSHRGQLHPHIGLEMDAKKFKRNTDTSNRNEPIVFDVPDMEYDLYK